VIFRALPAALGLALVLAPACHKPGRAPMVDRLCDGGPCQAGQRGAWDQGTRRFAVIIGSNRGNAGRPPLRYAEQDAARLILVMRELGSVDENDAHLMLAPTAASVRASLANLRQRVSDARKGVSGLRTLVLLYYSGHSDGRALELGPERLEFQDVQRAMIDTGADVRVMIVDACQSGSLLALKGGRPGAAFELGKVREVSNGEAILTSAAENEEAIESADLQGSYFSHHLLSGLRGAADVNRDGRVTLSEAYDYAAARTVAETTATIYGAQHPAYRLRLSGQGDLALTEIPVAHAALEVEGLFDRVLIIDAAGGSVAAEWTPGSARRLALTPGPYLVKAWQGRQVSTGRLTLRSGQRHPVTAAMLEPTAAVSPGPAVPAPPPARAAAQVAPVAPSETVLRHLLTSDRDCQYRCAIDPDNLRTDCDGAVSFLASERGRVTVAIDLPARQSLLRLRFETCDPQGLWLNLGDSPSCNGGGGDDTQFSNDAELELRNSSLWLFANDYGRPASKTSKFLTEGAGFVASAGCSTRTLIVGDGLLHSAQPAIDVRSPFALRLDPAVDDEGKPDRRWYLGINRSVGSSAPDRSGSGLKWVELCIR
jgi:hypothetical protein